MKFTQIDSGYLLRLEIGEPVVETITEFLNEKGVKSGFISGIGAVKNVELGYFDFSGRKYSRNSYPGDFEVVSLMGNISLVDEKPFMHAHILIADDKNRTFGGHLFKAEVAVTLEVNIHQNSQVIRRATDPATGLNLLDIKNR